MEFEAIIEIKDNAFARQFETITKQGLVTVEYSFQEKKIFLTKINFFKKNIYFYIQYNPQFLI